MEQTNKPLVPTWLSALLLIFCLVAVILNASEMITNTSTNFNLLVPSLSYVAYIFATFFAGFYYVGGYKKESASYYTLVVVSYAVAILLSVLLNGMMTNLFGIVAFALEFGFICVLWFAKDLGEKKSKIFSLLIVAASVITFAYYGITAKFVFAGGLESFSSLLSNILLSVMIFIMIFAKYRDKAARGSK